ncbi:MAG TPA: hypothetical protein VHL53_11365 [Acidimicrobiia bacterium]|nr:hypothetical protein [Acidimicrobiia bacterium]
MGKRGWWAAGIVIALAIGFAAPAGASQTTFDDTCAGVYGHNSIGDLEKTTDPPAGSTVTSGQDLTVTLQWPTSSVAGERQHRVMDCVSVDKGAPQLWAEKQFTTAEGQITLAEVVPVGLAPGSTICSQSFLKTAGSFGPVTRWSEKTCFPVGTEGSYHALSRIPSPPAKSSPPDHRSTPTTRRSQSAPPSSWSPPPGSGDYVAPWPPWEKAPRVAESVPVSTTSTTLTATKPLQAAPAPRKASGTQSAAAPAPVKKSPGTPGTLPRTGAGVVVLSAIAAVALFSGRQLRKASERIADNLPVPAVPVDEDDEPTLILGRRW